MRKVVLPVLLVLAALTGCASTDTSCTVHHRHAIVTVQSALDSPVTITREQLHLLLQNHKPVVHLYHRVVLASGSPKILVFPSGEAYRCFVEVGS